MRTDGPSFDRLRTVVLRHETPDGGFHFDWMLEPPATASDAAGKLITFRVAQRPDAPGVARLTAERLPNHRAVYLTFEGELTGNRGRVKRVAQGEVMFPGGFVDCMAPLEFICAFEGAVGDVRWVATLLQQGGADWTIERMER